MAFARAALAAGLMAACLAAPQAEAYNCKLPGLKDAAKRTVCRNRELARLNDLEAGELHAVSGKLGYLSIGTLRADREVFEKRQRACSRDARCHEAALRSQISLYRDAAACADLGEKELDCITATIAKHRQATPRPTP